MHAALRRKRWLTALMLMFVLANALPVLFAGGRALLSLKPNWTALARSLDWVAPHVHIHVVRAIVYVEPFLLAIWAGFGRQIFGRRVALSLMAIVLMPVSDYLTMSFVSRFGVLPVALIGYLTAEFFAIFTLMFAICFSLVRAARLQIGLLEEQNLCLADRSRPLRLLQIFQLTALVALGCAWRRAMIPYLGPEVFEALSNPLYLSTMLLCESALLGSFLPFVWLILGEPVKRRWLLLGAAIAMYFAVACLRILLRWPNASNGEILSYLVSAGSCLAAFCVSLWLLRKAGYRIARQHAGGALTQAAAQPPLPIVTG